MSTSNYSHRALVENAHYFSRFQQFISLHEILNILKEHIKHCGHLTLEILANDNF